MDIERLVGTINYEKHDFSLLLVDPKPTLLEWLAMFVKGTKLEKLRLYYPDGNRAILIPNVQRFHKSDSLDAFIDMMKPKILRMELRRFQATPEQFGHPITSETFDHFFAASIRDSVNLMSDFDLSVGPP